MKLSPLNLARLACLVALHVSIVGVVLFALGAVGQGLDQPARWPQLTAAMLLAALLDRVVQILPRAWRPRAWLAGGLLIGALLLKAMMGGGLSPLTGWGILNPEDYAGYQELIFSSVALLYLWWRGSRLIEIDYDAVGIIFRRGLIILLVALPFLQIFVAAPFNQPEVFSALTAYVVTFVGSALLSLAISNIMGRESGRRRRWIATTVLPVLALILASIGIVAVFSATLRRLLAETLQVIIITIYWLISPIIALFMAALSWILQGALTPPPGAQPAATPTPAPTPGPQPDPLAQIRQAYPEPASAATLEVWRIAGVLILLVLTIVALRWMLAQARGRQQAEQEERSSLWSWAEMRRDLFDMVNSLLDPLRRKRPGLRDTLAALRGNDPITRIRRAYVRLLLLAEEHERARAPHQTPREYLPQVEALAPGASAAMSILTATYEHARYGPPPKEKHADTAEQALKSIHDEVRRSAEAG